MKKYVIVGVGSRATCFRDAILENFSHDSKLLAVCDNDKGRLEASCKYAAKFSQNVKAYHSDDFDKMLQEQKPDYVIVCTLDRMHDEYICRSLNAGVDVITEKPMTIDETKCQRIVDTVKKTGKSVRVTFNYRYSPPRTQIKKLLMSGIIGRVLSVEFQWMLDTNHGADYFRRWHRNKQNSGGLLVHKATHHFDLINWWLGTTPETVMADGSRVFYNEQQAKRYGLEKHGKRCRNCPVKDKCNFYLDISSYAIMKELYLDCEQYSGYKRDLCIFENEIDIEDTMNVVVKYKNGAYMSYSLTAFSPWEGYRVAINGTKGRLEQICHESTYVSGDNSVPHSYQPQDSAIIVYPQFKTPYQVEVEQQKGAHGGGDYVLMNDIFGTPQNDEFKRCADYVQGAYSILVGIAANKSIKTGQKIRIDDLVKGLPEPGYLPIPADTDTHIPYVAGSCRMQEGVRMEANLPIKIELPE